MEIFRVWGWEHDSDLGLYLSSLGSYSSFERALEIAEKQNDVIIERLVWVSEESYENYEEAIDNQIVWRRKER